MSQSESRENSSEFVSLADYLLESKDSILEKWRGVIREKEDQASALDVMSRDDFYNSIPLFIDHLCKNFRGEESQLEKVSKEHGSHRWQFGFRLRNLTMDWGTLHSILMDRINEARDSLPISIDTLTEAQKRLAVYVHRSIKNSVDEFYKFQRKKAEVHMNDLEEALRKRDELTLQRGENLQQASHDLGGSMAVIQMNLAMLQKKPLNDDTGELVEQLSRSTDSLKELLDNLLDLFRLEAGREVLKISEFDAAELLRDLCENILPLASEKNLELRSSGNDKLIVQSDRVKIQRIAQNLLLNSLKYTNEGHIEIEWTGESDRQWMLCVRDTGPGMKSTYAAPFLKTSPGEKETSPKKPPAEAITGPSEVQLHSEGIGLSIVRRLCDMLDAVVKIETEAGKGTEFRIMFPLELSGGENV
ncbi:MAG: HAMP domain-containing sensor histidine kinase [Balneolaceae bacterium]